MPFNERVEIYIERIIEQFQKNPELFLTESDLKCRLFMELDSDPVLSQEEVTKDGAHRTNYVHSETAYFVEGRLDKNRVDITVVKPSNYDFANQQIVGRKGYYFVEPSIGIELKLNKLMYKNDIITNLIKDLKKLTALKTFREESTFYLLFLDKKNIVSQEDIDWLQNSFKTVKIFHSTIDSN
ncbi:MAG: hypothetical protein ACOWW1_00330 [archaeon]